MRTMKSSVMYKNKFMMGDITLRRLLMIPCDMFLRDHCSNTRSIDMLGSVRVRVDSIGDELLQLW